jgi:hypothetical protein
MYHVTPIASPLSAKVAERFITLRAAPEIVAFGPDQWKFHATTEK